MLKGNFIIRVYGILINENLEVLLSDELYKGIKITKFPGGGLKYGEGTIDCLKREALEEFGQPIEIIEHFYTTDFFQESFFHKNAQLISIFYRIKLIGPIKFKISEKPFDFEMNNGNFSFRWKKIDQLKEDEFTFPVEKHVCKLLKYKYLNSF